MSVARDIHAAVFQNATATFMARVEDATGQEINQASVASINYSVYELDVNDPTVLNPMSGHDQEPLAIADVVFDSPQTGETWTVDTVGYNFRHELDVSQDEAFTTPGGVYQVRYELLPVTGQKIVFRFQLRCI